MPGWTRESNSAEGRRSLSRAPIAIGGSPAAVRGKEEAVAEGPSLKFTPAERIRTPFEPQASPWAVRTVLRKLATFTKRKPYGALGAVIVILLFCAAIFAPVIAPYDPIELNAAERLQPPSARHLVGTDQLGRDLFSRLIYGSRISLSVGLAVVVLSAVPGVALGLVAAFYGGWIDYMIGRVVDTVQAIPNLILLIAILVFLGPSMINVIIALSVRRAITECRVFRSAALAIQGQTYIEAARALGAPNWWIILRYLFPNITPLLIVVTSLGVAGAILAEASLSFLGYGIPPPAPSWGGMLSADGRAYMFVAPWMLLGPAFSLSIVVFGTNMFGDALRDVLDPRLRGT